MAIDEQSRHDLFKRLEEILGGEHAALLMEHLPPVGWADVATKRDLEALAVATKRDLEQLEARLDLRFEAFEHRLTASFRGELIAQTRIMIFSMATAFVGVAGVTLAAVRLS